MANGIALIVIVLVAIYFFLLGLVALLCPAKASAFLRGFASRAQFHYVELSIRVLVGTAFVVRAPDMVATQTFLFFGWMLIATSVCLLVLPWRWHERFAQQSVPKALRFLTPIAVISIALSGAIMYCAVGSSPGV